MILNMNEPYFVKAKVSPEDQIDNLTRQLLRDKIKLLPISYQIRFNEIWRHRFPNGDIIDQMSHDELYSSIGLVDRTLEAVDRAAARTFFDLLARSREIT
jgi:hypothetical protein